ncbi:MAG: ribosomal protein S18-alanine N-acetyltransferase [Acidimicrobiia bacterium]|nr:ribosomal protein S18-alanine N-acetyltransferase [Acidimicrobiia bacterium]
MATVASDRKLDDAQLEPVIIMTMRRRHLRNVLRIEEKTSTTPWSLGLFLAEVRREEREYLVALSGSRVVGFAGLLYVVGEGHITTVAVDPDKQGGRIGTRLMLVLARRAIVHGADSVTLEVRASNARALALYRRFGFAPSGVRKDYYKDPTEDALVLWAHDVDTPAYADRLSVIESQLPTPLVLEDSTTPDVSSDDITELDAL